jgi:hypothetical protein
VEPLVGFEPTANPLLCKASGAGWSPDSSPDTQLILKIIEAWPRLNPSLKLAILAIVDTANG